MNTTSIKQTSTFKSLLLLVTAFALCASLPSASLANTHTKKPIASRASILTVNHLKNACYQMPDLACGFKNVKLKNGVGENDGMKVIFKRATFGTIEGYSDPCGVVQLSYWDDTFGWSQQLVFIRAQGNKLVQIAEYSLDERESLKAVKLTKGAVVLETKMPDPAAKPIHAKLDKVTKIHLSQSDEGCTLTASEWQRTPASSSLLKPYVDLAPYLYTVEDRIGKYWSSSQKERNEHVVINFKIKPSGEVDDLRANTRSTRDSVADQAAIEAVRRAAPFAPLPEAGMDEVDVCLEFQSGVVVNRKTAHLSR